MRRNKLVPFENWLDHRDSCAVAESLTIPKEGLVHFVGTSVSEYDLVAQKFREGSYKDFKTIAFSTANFYSNMFDYALQYALLEDAKKPGSGVLVAVQLPYGLRFFDLTDPDDYYYAGLPKAIAKVFQNAEPYFAFDSFVPNFNKPNVPQEFVAAKLIARFGSPMNVSSHGLKLIQNNTVFQFPQNYSELVIKHIKYAFRTAIGKEKLKDLNGNDVVDSYLAKKTLHKEQIKHLLSANALQKFSTNSDGYLQDFIGIVPRDIMSKPIVQNFLKLYSSDKVSTVRHVDSNSRQLIDAYLKMFKFIKKYDLSHVQNNPIIQTELQYIQELRKKSAEEGSDVHAYINALQLVFLYMVVGDKFSGVVAPEKIGYENVRKQNLDPDYGKKENGSQLEQTVILTKPINDIARIKTFGHEVNQLHILFDNKKIKRIILNSIDNIKSVEKYKRLYDNIIKPRIDAEIESARKAREEARRKAEEDARRREEQKPHSYRVVGSMTNGLKAQPLDRTFENVVGSISDYLNQIANRTNYSFFKMTVKQIFKIVNDKQVLQAQYKYPLTFVKQ